ncbi:MAG: hypothetical protein JNM68_07905, partial [Dinghuibacter sp.]|nr:hypothetical protein [Dinghuibacter sp.]
NKGQQQFELLQPSASGIQVEGEIRDIQTLTVNGKKQVVFLRNNSRPAVYRVNQ